MCSAGDSADGPAPFRLGERRAFTGHQPFAADTPTQLGVDPSPGAPDRPGRTGTMTGPQRHAVRNAPPGIGARNPAAPPATGDAAARRNAPADGPAAAGKYRYRMSR